MKKKLLGIVVLACAAGAFGCASTPWLEDITGDPRLSECRDYGDPLPVRLAVAPAKMPVREEAPAEETRERNPITAEPGQIREAIVASLGKFNIFSEVRPLDVGQADASDEAVMQAAWEQDYDLVLSLDIKNLEAFYDGVNGWYIPNLVNWLFLLVPSWWIKDEVYGATMSIEATLHSARSGVLLYQEEHSVQFKRGLNDFQRGWQLAGIFRVPGSLGEANWRKIGRQLLPGLLREVQVHTVLGLHEGFRQTVSELDLKSLLETRLGLIVGISRHKDFNIPKLKYTEDDAISVHKYLTDPEGGQLPPRNVKLLTNEHASKEGILKGLDYLARKSRGHDSVVVYFAGYGVSVVDRDETGNGDAEPKLYLTPYDVDSHDVEGSCISLDEIEEKLSGIEAHKLLIVLDTSFNGNMGSRSLAGMGEGAVFENLLQRSGRYLLLSGKPAEGAMEIDDHRHGVFTFYMLEGLKGGADDNKDGVITLGELHTYLAGKVAEETEMEGSAQHPQLRGAGAPDMIMRSAP